MIVTAVVVLYSIRMKFDLGDCEACCTHFIAWRRKSSLLQLTEMDQKPK